MRSVKTEEEERRKKNDTTNAHVLRVSDAIARVDNLTETLHMKPILKRVAGMSNSRTSVRGLRTSWSSHPAIVPNMADFVDHAFQDSAGLWDARSKLPKRGDTSLIETAAIFSAEVELEPGFKANKTISDKVVTARVEFDVDSIITARLMLQKLLEEATLESTCGFCSWSRVVSMKGDQFSWKVFFADGKGILDHFKRIGPLIKSNNGELHTDPEFKPYMTYLSS